MNFPLPTSLLSNHLSIYVHIPWCVHKCPYCDFNSHSLKNKSINEFEEIYTQAVIDQVSNSEIRKNKTWPTWRRDDKSIVSCTEKIKVMSDNFDEIQQIVQDAFEDGLLMEVSDDQMRQTLITIIGKLRNPLKKKSS